MPVISFIEGRKSLTVPEGANLMSALLDAGIPVASSCNADGVCAKCKIVVLEGRENLSAENKVETFLKEKFSFDSGLRISCQTQVNGDITIDAAYW